MAKNIKSGYYETKKGKVLIFNSKSNKTEIYSDCKKCGTIVSNKKVKKSNFLGKQLYNVGE